MEEPVPVLTPDPSPVHSTEDPFARPGTPEPSEPVSPALQHAERQYPVPPAGQASRAHVSPVAEENQQQPKPAAEPSPSPAAHSPFELAPETPTPGSASGLGNPGESGAQARSQHSQPVSPFAAVTPALRSPFTDDLEHPDEPAPAASAEQHHLQDGPNPAETVPYSPAAAGNPDPTRGEIEFSKLKPLSETPSEGTLRGNSSPLPEPEPVKDPVPSDTSSLQGESAPQTTSSPISASSVSPGPATPNVEPAPALAETNPFTPVTPEPAHPSASPFSVPEPAEQLPSSQFSPASEPQVPTQAAASPFTAVNPVESNPAAEPRQSPQANPQTSPFEPEAPSAAPASWWPGDSASAPSDTPEEAPSPFVAVGSSSNHPASSGSSVADPHKGSVGADPSGDREEVERMLRLLRERQENA